MAGKRQSENLLRRTVQNTTQKPRPEFRKVIVLPLDSKAAAFSEGM